MLPPLLPARLAKTASRACRRYTGSLNDMLRRCLWFVLLMALAGCRPAPTPTPPSITLPTPARVEPMPLA